MNVDIHNVQKVEVTLQNFDVFDCLTLQVVSGDNKHDDIDLFMDKENIEEVIKGLQTLLVRDEV